MEVVKAHREQTEECVHWIATIWYPSFSLQPHNPPAHTLNSALSTVLLPFLLPAQLIVSPSSAPTSRLYIDSSPYQYRGERRTHREVDTFLGGYQKRQKNQIWELENAIRIPLTRISCSRITAPSNIQLS